VDSQGRIQGRIGEDRRPLNEFLERRRQELISFYGPDLGEREFENLTSDLSRHFDRLEQVLTDPDRDAFSQLVLGRVQSGKTGHLAATIAWAAQSGFAAAAIVTGLTGALFKQTQHRLRSDLGTLGSRPVQVVEVPTQSEGRGEPFQAASQLMARAADLRMDTRLLGHPMPLLVALKKPQRVIAMRLLIEQLRSTGDGRPVLVIDDEADQASPNAGWRDQELTATYSALGELRRAIEQHIFLAYTATPQAILLSPLANDLRPDRCLVTQPGSGYFGLSDVVDPGFSGRTVLTDTNSIQQGQRPVSLDRAITRLLLISVIRSHFPDLFYASRPEGVGIDGRMRSVQFLLHPSGRTADHRDAFDMVVDFRQEWIEAFRKDENEFFRDVIDPVYRELLHQMPDDLAARLPQSEVNDLYREVVRVCTSSMEIRIINSDAGGPTDRTLPSSRAEWDEFEAWILIGGDILGRGVTIPQLVSTYIYRIPRVAQVDTTNQQMRFCGYRRDYAHMISVEAPADIWDRYEQIQMTDEAVLQRATAWDVRGENLSVSPPSIFYVAPAGGSVEPTRTSVIDPNIVDFTLGTRIFQALSIGSPRRLVRNRLLTVEFLEQHSGEIGMVEGAWGMMRGVNTGAALSLLSAWVCTPEEKSRLRRIVELFEVSWEGLTLADSEINVFVNQSDLLERNISTWGLDEPASRRGSNAASLGRIDWNWNTAVDAVLSSPTNSNSPFERVSINGFLGDEHVRLANHGSSDSINVFVQPVGITRTTRDVARIGIGLAMGIQAGSSVQVRVIGHADS